MQKILYILAETEDFWSSRLPLALAAQQHNCNILVAAPGAATDPKMKEYGFSGFDLPEAEKGFSPASVLKTMFTVRKLLNDEKPDTVHTITLKYSFITGLAAQGYKRSRLVFTIAGLGYLFSGHGVKPEILRLGLSPFIRHALKHPSAWIIFQNSDDMHLMMNKGYVRKDRAVLIRGSGIDLNKYSPQQNKESEPPLVIMPTRLVRDKGISVYIAMAKILQKRQIPARFQLAGGLTDHNPRAMRKDELEEMISGSPVEWLGKVSDMPALYAESAVVVFPSWYREGIPRVLLEGAAMGKPLVTTDHPGCREAVNNNENGFLVPVKNPEAVADAVEKLLKDKSLRASMGSKSRALAELEFDIEKIVAQTMKIYGF